MPSPAAQRAPTGQHARVVSYGPAEESYEFRCQKILYQAFVNEMMEMVAPLETSLDASRLGSTFCESCDYRIAPFLSRPLGNDALLERQLRFEPEYDPSGHVVELGHWTIYRFWRAGFSNFPSCENLARGTAEKLVRKLAGFGRKGSSYAAREVTYKAQTSFIKARVRWATKEDLTEKMTFLPQLAHVNVASSSSRIRLCVVPNRELFVNSELGVRSYNSFIRKNSVILPKFVKLSLVSALSLDFVMIDIEDAYGCLRNSVTDARHAAVFCLKTQNGLPSYDLNQCPDGVMHPLLQTSSSFGQADVSRLSQMALSRMASVYREHKGVGEVEEKILMDIESVLKLFSYADDSQIPALSNRVLDWCQGQGRCPPRPSCQCPIPCKSWDCSSLLITSQDVFTFESFIKKEAKAYLCCMAKAFVRVANFSSHRVKFVKATNVEMQEVLDNAGVTNNQPTPSLELEYDVVRPSPDQVLSEVARMTVGGEEQVDGVTTGEMANQLGKAYANNQTFLKTQRLYICHFVGKSKRKTPTFSSFESLKHHCDAKKVRISKISLSSLCGQFWDPAGVHLSIPRTYAKEAARTHLLNGPQTWQSSVSPKVEGIFWKAIEAYFLTCRLPQPRCNLLLHPAARFVLIGGSDGAENMQSLVVSALSYMTVDKQHVGRAQHLNLANFANNVQIIQNVPLVEVVAFHKLLVTYTQTLVDLRSLGIHIPPSSCYLTVDSKTVLIQIRTRAHLYKKRVSSLISRIQLLLAQFDLNPFQHVYWIDQHALPMGARYHADILSKTKQEKASVESILKDHHDLHSMSWIEDIPPDEWLWLHRDIAVPRLNDRELLQDLGVDEDHLQQIKDFLERPTVVSAAAFSHVDHQGGDREVGGPGAEPPPGALLACTDSVRPPTRGVSSVPDHLPVRPPAVLPTTERAGDDLREETPAQGLADGHAGGVPAQGLADEHTGDDLREETPAQGLADASLPSTGRVSVNWKEELDHLIARKQMYGLGAKSVVSILACVFRFIANLKHQCARRRAGVLQTTVGWPKWLRPWCGKSLCGLQDNPGCGQPHPRLSPPDVWGRPLDSQSHLTRDNSHFLFQKQSSFGYNLGCPEALASVTLKLAAHVIGGDANIDHQEWRVLAFDHLCFLNQDQFEVNGFSVSKFESIWGFYFVAAGRKQRDWIAQEDTVPRLRMVASPSVFATLCLTTAHAASLGESHELSRLYLISLRMMVEKEKKALKVLQRGCSACNLSIAFHQRNDTKMRSNHLGPSGRLTAIGSYPPGLACCQVDLIGPLTYLTKTAQEVKLFLLISVSQTWGQTRLVPIRSKAPESVMLGLKTLSLQSSVRFQLICHDDGGEFRGREGPGGNFYSPMHEVEGQPLVEKWFESFRKGIDEIELQGMGIFVRFGKSRNCAAAERRVADVKAIFKDFHLFTKGSDSTDIHEILFLCALTEHVIHSRPILIYGQQVYSLNTLISLMTNTGYLAAQGDGLEPQGEGVRRKGKVAKICHRLSQLRTQLTRLMMAHHLDTFLDNIHRRERIKTGKGVEELNVGDIVFDSIGFQQTGHISGSLAKIVAIGSSHNHLLVSKAMLKSRGTTFSQVCVARPANELHFVCEGTLEPVAMGELETFNILKYLPQMDQSPPLWTLSNGQQIADNNNEGCTIATPSNDGYVANNGEGSIATPVSGGNVAATSGDVDGPNLNTVSISIVPQKDHVGTEGGGSSKGIAPRNIPHTRTRSGRSVRMPARFLP